MTRPAALRVYRRATAALLPAISSLLRRRFVAKGGDRDRWAERLGHDTATRSDAPVIWVHAVSMGETMSALPLIDALIEARPEATILLTTGTASAAGLAERRLPRGAHHRFAPLDAPGPVARFLDLWQPERAIFLESELWPETIGALARRDIPLALVSARLTERSARRWATRAPRVARWVFSRIALVLAQDEATAERARSLGAARVEVAGSLKTAAARLPVDAADHAGMTDAIGSRPVWVAASTHEGEEEVVLAAHDRVLSHCPEALLILAPRHVERAGDIDLRGLAASFRSSGGLPAPDDAIYMADSYGEMGLWFSLSPVVFLGGSLRPGIGGHNPLEPAAFGATVLTGPHTPNAQTDFERLISEGRAARVTDAETLSAAVLPHLNTRPDTTPTTEGGSDLARRIAELCLSL